jgi:hypothetical protein
LLEAGHDVCSGFCEVATEAFYCSPIATVFVSMLLLSALYSLTLPAEKLTAQVRKHGPDQGNDGSARENTDWFRTKERYMKFRPLHDRIVIKKY